MHKCIAWLFFYSISRNNIAVVCPLGKQYISGCECFFFYLSLMENPGLDDL